MASSPITSCLIDGKKMETVMTDFTFLGAKITVDSDCSQEIKRYLLLERKAVTNLESVLKSRHQKKQKQKKAEASLCQQRSVSQSYGFSTGKTYISHVWM